ncbi:MAG: DEAD/DEAH box helicase [Candidatus Aquicultor sp.]|jgi:ATP-dependent RNA helicase RhlE|nr:DEAD/DEAH box helicase [Candidatus Aquicultor sp.]
MSFKRLGVALPLVEWTEAMGFSEPTPIQKQAIPQALNGRDIIGCAQTGTGKTAAFVLPILQRINSDGVIKALVVTPTRELATQIEAVAQSCSRHTKHRAMAVYGGVPYAPQGRKVSRGIDLLIATPGRLLDMMRRGDVNLSKVEILVLDEADRMLDMGFLPDIKRILKEVPAKRQNMLFSATVTRDVMDVIEDALTNPLLIEISHQKVPVESIKQTVYPVSAMQKSDLLIELLKQRDYNKVVVFTRTKRRADFLSRVLIRKGIQSTIMHSDRSQAQRNAALAGFKANRFQVLVATDIIARGIDVEGISHVVNYDIPSTPEDYVHRIGRTGRASATGTAISLLSHEEVGDLREIERMMGISLNRDKLKGFEYTSQQLPGMNRPANAAAAKVASKLAYDGGAKRSIKRRTKRR